MQEIKGISASNGIAKGVVHIEKLKDLDEIEERKINNNKISAELERLEKAVDRAISEISKIKEKTEDEMSKKEADIFQAHIMFLQDPEFTETIRNNIEKNNFSAESAVKKAMQKYVAMFEKMDNEYMKARKADIEDVSRRVIQKLVNKNNEKNSFKDNTVVIARDLTPSMTANLDKDKATAFITAIGSRTSHTAIMARTLGIPAVVGAGDKLLEIVSEDDKIIVDGSNGKIVINPDNKTLANYEEKIAEYEKRIAVFEKYKNKKAVTKDGEEIEVAGNIGNINDVKSVLENGGEGIGLFRTEFLYMDRNSLPDEEEQFEVYRKVAKKMDDKPVVIRTLDVGGDKDLP